MLRATYLLPLIILSLLITACTGLAGEPEIVATIAQVTALPATTVPLEPALPPDIANGARLFATHCTDCHGEEGDGQGSLVESGQILAPPNMQEANTSSGHTPLEWYDIISNGRIENLMPPWKDALTEQERWDVTFYTYLLAYSQDDLIFGEQVWNDKCNGCPQMHDLINLTNAIKISDLSFGNNLDREVFESDLSNDEIRAAVAYARSLSVSNPSSIAMIAEPLPVGDESAEIVNGEITGTVKHGTANGVLPDDLSIQMQYGNASEGYQVAETSLNEDGSYQFEDIPLTTAYTYTVGVSYRERFYTSSILANHPADIDYDIPITIYDLTDDPILVSVSRIDILIDPITVPKVGEGLRVTQLVRYNNDSDRVYTTGRTFGENVEPSLLIQVPVGAIITSDSANGRYLIVQDQESIVDTYAVFPGDVHEVFVEYFVPYEDGAIIDQPFNNRIDGEITITLSNNLTINSDIYTLQENSETANGVQVYAGNLQAQPNESLKFEVNGNPFQPSVEETQIVTSDNLAPILLMVVSIVILSVVGMVIWSSRKSNPQKEIDKLVRQIAELDAMHDSGQINHDVYQRQRQDLKLKLTQLMQSPSVENPPAE